MSIRYIYTFHTKFQLNSWNKGIQRTKIIMRITFFTRTVSIPNDRDIQFDDIWYFVCVYIFPIGTPCLCHGSDYSMYIFIKYTQSIVQTSCKIVQAIIAYEPHRVSDFIVCLGLYVCIYTCKRNETFFDRIILR